MKRTMRVRPAAKEFGVTESTVRSWCRKGEIAAVKIGKTWLVLVDELDEKLVPTVHTGGHLELPKEAA